MEEWPIQGATAAFPWIRVCQNSVKRADSGVAGSRCCAVGKLQGCTGGFASNGYRSYPERVADGYRSRAASVFKGWIAGADQIRSSRGAAGDSPAQKRETTSGGVGGSDYALGRDRYRRIGSRAD